MIQRSPHIESAQYNRAPQFTGLPSSAEYELGAESPGTFADMLAGLLRETGSTEPERADAGSGVEAHPPAETADADGSVIDDASAAGQSKRAGTALAENAPASGAPETGLKKTAASGAAAAAKKAGADAESDEAVLTPEETSILFAVDRLLNAQPDSDAPETISPEEEAWLSGEIMSDVDGRAVYSGFPFEDGAAESSGGETAFVETAFLQSAQEQTDGFSVENAEAAAAAALLDDASEAGGTSSRIETAAGFAEAASLQTAVFQNGAEQAQPEQQLRKAAPAGNEKEGAGRLDEVRSGRKRGASLEVRDFRTGAAAQSGGNLRGADGALEFAKVNARGEAPGEITLELRLPGAGHDAPLTESGWDAKAGDAVENLLARELHQNFNNDIVRHASIALRDGGEGTIKLALRPEALGTVKIRLEMAENKITGHIIVESEEALRAFEREIGSLEQAFRDSGFDGANLEMSLADGGGTNHNRQDAEAGPYMPQTAASRYDAALEYAEAPAAVDVYQRETALINMLA